MSLYVSADVAVRATMAKSVSLTRKRKSCLRGASIDIRANEVFHAQSGGHSSELQR